MTFRHPVRSRRLVTAVAAIMLSLAASVPALAVDEVRTGGEISVWVKVNSIRGIIDGQLVFETVSGSERRELLSNIVGLRMDAHPELAQAFRAIDEKDYKAAVEGFTEVAKDTRNDWLKNWSNFMRMRMYENLEQPGEAVEAYITLVRARADDYYIENPPLKVVLAGSDDDKKAVVRRLEAMKRFFRGDAATKAYDALIEVASISEAAVDSVMTEPTDGGNSKAGNSGMNGNSSAPKATDDRIAAIMGRDEAAESKVPMTVSIDPKDPVTQLLHKGQLQEALEMADKALQGKERLLAMRLYQRGLARIHLAQQSGSEDMYKDAGLDFMRVLVYFPGGRYEVAAKIELGLVHERIGRDKIAKRFWDDARLSMTEEDEPALWERLSKLRGDEPEAE